MSADRIFGLLLRILPGWFREEFAAEMATVFRAERSATSGSIARAGLWILTIRDLLALAWRLHTEALARDLTYATRSLRKTPAFTASAVLTLALGLGPTVVIASLLYQVVIAPLPFDQPDELVRVWSARPERKQTRVPLSTPDYMDFRSRQTAFEALAAHTGTSVAMMIGGTPRQVGGVLTSADLHRVLRVHAVVGRDLTDADVAPDAPPVVVLGAGLWRAEFGARRDVIGEVVQIDGRPTTIVGVLPEGLDFPVGSASAWLPLTLDPANAARGTHYLTATGRLRPDVAISQAEDALNSIALGLGTVYPDTNRGQTIEVFALKEQINGDSPRLLAVLTAAIAAVLLIACLNVASLLAVRTSARRAELAVRTALGATGRRLRRQLMVEHLVLATSGGVVAAPLGFGLHRVILEKSVLELPRTADAFGWQALGALAVLVTGIGVLFATVAVRRASHVAPAAALLSSARQTESAPAVRLRQVLVVAEVASALVLLVIAGLMLQSAQRLAGVDPGFRTEGVLTFGVVLPASDYMQPERRLDFADRVLERVRGLPGVRNAAIGGYAPMGAMRATRRFAPGDRPPPAPGAEPVAIDLPVGPGYFEVMGIPLIEGRTFEPRDTASAPPVLIVSQEFARQVFGSERVVGRWIRFFSSRPGGTPPPAREIVGVVGDVRHDNMRETPLPQMYAPYAQNAWMFLSFFVLLEGEPDAVAAAVQRVVAQVDPQRPARDLRTISQIVHGSTARHRTMSGMLLALAAMALLLASVGLYGVSATAAAARTRELAIRAAIGAEPGALLGLVLRQGLATAVVGVLVGAATSLAFTRWLGGLLYETAPQDPTTLTITAVVLLTVAGTASYIPARRALARNPADVLRSE